MRALGLWVASVEGCTQSGVLACSLERLLARAGGHLWASQGPRRGTPLSLRWGSRLCLPRACEADCEQLPQLLFLSPGSAQAVGSWQGEVVGGPLGSSGWIPCGRPQPCPLPLVTSHRLSPALCLWGGLDSSATALELALLPHALDPPALCEHLLTSSSPVCTP